MGQCQGMGTQSCLAILIQGRLLVHVGEELVRQGFVDLDSLPWYEAGATHIGKGITLSLACAICTHSARPNP